MNSWNLLPDSSVQSTYLHFILILLLSLSQPQYTTSLQTTTFFQDCNIIAYF